MLKKIYWKVIVCGLILILILNMAGRFHGFCDWYVVHIFPIWINTYGRFSALFPFSLEANYNREMCMKEYPSVICHEYAHLKGYIYEDEANFIAYLACIGSDDIFFQYSGYLSVYLYVEDAYLESVGDDQYLELLLSDQIVDLNYLATVDNMQWLSEEAEEEIYCGGEESFLNVDNITQISEKATDVSLKLYGVEDGIASYDRVTELLLQYYDGILY
ncbi:MAG: DUF3810 domain-containing protein [Lachnospiraceae bacterium]|nr:DUF3810 domain-containing protein [Lachnospiraceae bacterium]